jgi:FtsZ-interacting cell division protein ZipA
MFTYILIAVAAIVVVAVVVHEIRSWRRPGKQIAQNAPMDSNANNHARLIQGTNIHSSGPFDSSGGGL